MHHHTVLKLLSRDDKIKLKSSAVIANHVEKTWKKKLADAIKSYEWAIVEAIVNKSPLSNVSIDFYELFLEHAYDSMRAGITIAKSEMEERTRPDVTKLARGKMPTSFKDLRTWWDKSRIKKNKKIEAKAETLKKRYLEKCQSVWDKYSSEFQKGNVYNQADVVIKIAEAAKVTESRANTIVQTETTNYYNKVRRDYYDEVDSVTHYLFISIRDKRTTPWCKDRSGLVYKKGTDILEKETPSCHYSCRSEIVPLVRFNPTHKKLIENESLWRENNKCTPLLPGWTRDKDRRRSV